MALGSQYAAGASIVKPLDSYVPLANATRSRAEALGRSMERGLSRSRGGGGGGGMASISGSGPMRTAAEEKERLERDARNRYMATHHGQLPGPFAEKEMEYEHLKEMQKERLGVDRDQLTESARQFNRTSDREDLNAEVDREDKRFGLTKSKNEEGRTAEKHGWERDLHIRTQDHKDMMNAFMQGDFGRVMGWFIKNGRPGKDGGYQVPIIEPGDNPNTVRVQWPGGDGYEVMGKDALGQLLASQSPKFEAPKNQLEVEKTGYYSRGRADSGTLSAKDIEIRADAYARGRAGTGAGEDYENAYAEKKAELEAQYGGAGLTRTRGGTGKGTDAKRVVSRKRNKKTGEIMVEYADGTVVIEPGEKSGSDENGKGEGDKDEDADSTERTYADEESTDRTYGGN